MAVPDAHFIPVISLGAIADGNIPNPSSATSFTTTVLDTYRQIRQVLPQMPALGCTLFPPSPGYPGFFGAAEIVY